MGGSILLKIHMITLQFLDDKDWIAENFPTDVRTELALVTAENALLPENIQYVSVQRKQKIDFTPKKTTFVAPMSKVDGHSRLQLWKIHDAVTRAVTSEKYSSCGGEVCTYQDLCIL